MYVLCTVAIDIVAKLTLKKSRKENKFSRSSTEI